MVYHSAPSIEHLLSAGQLFVRMTSGNYWRLRRNGATKRWKRDPMRYRIPLKAGLKVYTEITNTTLVGDGLASGALFAREVR